MASSQRDVGKTTVPASATDGRAATKGVRVIKWLFPATDGPVTLLDPQALPVTIGRDDACGTVLDGAEISRRHAKIVAQGTILILQDAGSRNGSYVNGRLQRGAALGLGDVLRLGEWVGVVIEVPPEHQSAFKQGTISPGLYGGPTLRTAVEPALRAAASDLPIIIEGETGTGKDVLARSIHTASRRAGNFVAINCAALPESLAEAELFGYRRGAFTGAERASPGHFRAAHGGTLFLDEISDLPLALQAKVLRAIEQREVIPLGESSPTAVDARIIVASQRSLEAQVAERAFRADLFARLDGVTVQLPPLRRRIEDVPYLFARFVHEMGTAEVAPSVDPQLIEELCLYDWPLNVRELVLLVKRLLVIHGHEPTLRAQYLPTRLRDRGSEPAAAEAQAASADRQEVDYESLAAALRVHSGNISKAAAHLGISRQRAYRLIEASPDLNLSKLRASRSPDE